MHEVSLMESALEIAFRQAKEQEATRIHRLGMRVGSLSSVVPDALQFAFDALTPGTLAEGGCLEIETITAECVCEQCGVAFEPDSFIYACPSCGLPSANIQRGREIEVAFVEVS